MKSIYKNLLALGVPMINQSGQTMYYKCRNDHEWPMIAVSDSCEQMLDCSTEELITNEICYGQLIDPTDSDVVWEVIQESIFKNTPYQLIYKIKTPLSNEKVIFEQGWNITLDNSEPPELHGFITDISELVGFKQPNLLSNYFELFSIELKDLIEKMNGYKITDLKISHREIQVIVYLCQGMSMKEIGAQLKLSPRTVEMHLKRIKQKLLCHSTAELRKLFFMTEFGKKIFTLI